MHIEEIIQDLIEQCDFKDLPILDQELVLGYVTEEKYTLLRQTVQASVAYFEAKKTPVPKPSAITLLNERLAQPKTVPVFTGILQSIFTYKIPAYQMGIGLLLLFFGIQYFQSPQITSVDSIKTEYVYQTLYDTVEKLIFKEVPLEMVVYKKASTSDKIGLPSQNIHNHVKPVALPVHSPSIELKDVQKSLGNTRINEADLNQFRVSM
ncbi:MAG: hypothetical protein ACI9JN_002784 [Bacteroidia bacterium]|jgi:hypothetical protein